MFGIVVGYGSGTEAIDFRDNRCIFKVSGTEKSISYLFPCLKHMNRLQGNPFFILYLYQADNTLPWSLDL